MKFKLSLSRILSYLIGIVITALIKNNQTLLNLKMHFNPENNLLIKYLQVKNVSFGVNVIKHLSENFPKE